MFRRVLVANRGEIALRVFRACREMGIEPVAVFSEADRNAPHLRLAEHSVCIGPASPARSYLDIPSLIAAAEILDVEAIHPGYGFLAENARFAEVCRECGIRFIGPSPEAIAKAGDKVEARAIAKKAGVPVVPGSEGKLESEEDALALARSIGFPVILKASAGGGGRGMRVAHNEVSLVQAFHAARSEAEATFKDSSVYLERYLERPRHVEVQVLADERGGIVHLGERDCTLQRRHQKLVEESPSPALTAKRRAEIGEAAIAFARAVGYTNAGTVEFLLDRDGRFYFMEMNARIQVEHPVTEMVTGIDLVREQIRIAAGEPLGYGQGDVRLRGHAIEVRVNAEDPEKRFAPSPGLVSLFVPPGGPGIRVDTHVCAGMRIPAEYDSLLAKVVAYAEDRPRAIRRILRALDEFLVSGVPTTIPALQRLVSHGDFERGVVDTGFVERVLGL